jgi:dTDP-4-dehydrorhamnose 3,5-epimerase
MRILQTEFEGLLLIYPEVLKDARGTFNESYNRQKHLRYGLDQDWVQDNLSYSSYGVVRGLHFQHPPYAQAKIVQAIHGRILDVVVDIRRGSPTFGRHLSVELDDEERLQILIPKGFAHGFSVLSESAVVMYKTDAYYNDASEAGIRFDDPDLAIDWKISSGNTIVSPKDQALPLFSELNTNFVHGR